MAQFRYRHPNDLPRCKVYHPDAWREQVAGMNPFNTVAGSWICIDADAVVSQTHDEAGDGLVTQLPSTCPICFKLASNWCSKCRCVAYCSTECQRQHWKESHKLSCKANPKPYVFKPSLQLVRSLRVDDYTQPHEFILIKPTGRMMPRGGSNELLEICDKVLESADCILDMKGFGRQQIQPLWVCENQFAPIVRSVCQRFGWTSGVYGVDNVEGYRLAEDQIVYWVLSDDCFLNTTQAPRMQTSYYGGSIFPSIVMQGGKQVRGNLVFFATVVQNRVWQEQPQHPEAKMVLQMTDDAQLQFEYLMYPISKLDVAYLLYERRKAMEKGAYTRRMWRSVVRREERHVEVSSKGGSVSFL